MTLILVLGCGGGGACGDLNIRIQEALFKTTNIHIQKEPPKSGSSPKARGKEETPFVVINLHLITTESSDQ